MIYCLDCKSEISSNAKTCPVCGSSEPQGHNFGCVFIIITSLGIGLFSNDNWGWGILCFVVSAAFIVAMIGNYKLARTPPNDRHNNSYDEDDFPLERSNKPRYSSPPVEQYWNKTEQVPVHACLQIDYTSASGDFSQRIVDISHYDGSCYLEGFCYLRNDHRTFRIDRVSEAVDTETGEVIQSIPDHLKKKYESTPEFKLQDTFEKAKDIIKVLYYVGKADSQLRAPELEIIGKVIRKIAKDENIENDQIKKELNRLQIPSLQAFKLAVGRIHKNNPKNLQSVQVAAKAIVNTQKTISPGEKEALDYIEKKLQSPQ